MDTIHLVDEPLSPLSPLSQTANVKINGGFRRDASSGGENPSTVHKIREIRPQRLGGVARASQSDHALHSLFC